MLKIRINGIIEEYKEGTTFGDIARRHSGEYQYPIYLACEGTRVRELFRTPTEDGNVSFITAGERTGMEAYRRTVVFMMMKAFHDAAPEGTARRMIVRFDLGNGLFCRIRGRNIDPQVLKAVEDRMHELVDMDLPIEKVTMKTEEALNTFRKRGLHDKTRLFSYRRSEEMNMYSLGGYKDYFYHALLPSTGLLKLFRLIPYEDGFVLQVPDHRDPSVLPEFVDKPLMYKTMNSSMEWCGRLELDSVGELNDWIVEGKGNELVLIQEAIMEKTIGNIASEIAESGKKVILIAGPSSSGKTTFSHRLSIQLRALGLHPHPIACDNYYADRATYPLDADGKPDYEAIECLRIEKLNDDLNALIRGNEVEIPLFNFVTGKPEAKGMNLKLGKNDVIVLEGIHCLNDELTYAVSKDDKYRIFISALTRINMDEHNRVPLTDGRLIRRMIRDARTRGTSAKETIAMWESVRNGEDKNITPYQENADVMVNSSLLYELAVLKPYAEPLLYGIGKDEPEYTEARRLLKFFEYILPIPDGMIPKTSLVREFIGGGCFDI